MAQGRVSMVMVNWNGIEFLDHFVPSVLSQTYPNIEFFVIDNASEDSSVDWLKAQYPKLRVLRQDRNLGYAGAHNLGIRLSTGEFYMPLNCDLVLTPTFVAEMVGAIKGSHETGSVTGKLLRLGVDGTPSTLIDSTGHVLFKTRTVANRGDGERDTGQYDTHTEVFGVSGTAPLYRRAMLESVRMGDDYLDEDYFAYWEDVDLDWRAQHTGWRARYAPRAVAHHVRLGSLAGRQDWVRLAAERHGGDSAMPALLHVLPWRQEARVLDDDEQAAGHLPPERRHPLGAVYPDRHEAEGRVGVPPFGF